VVTIHIVAGGTYVVEIDTIYIFLLLAFVDWDGVVVEFVFHVVLVVVVFVVVVVVTEMCIVYTREGNVFVLRCVVFTLGKVTFFVLRCRASHIRCSRNIPGSCRC
jgi:hypothetical protein